MNFKNNYKLKNVDDVYSFKAVEQTGELLLFSAAKAPDSHFKFI